MQAESDVGLPAADEKGNEMRAYIPTCPKCGRECFVPSFAITDSSSEPGLVWCCRDMGHWVGDSNAVVWKQLDFPQLKTVATSPLPAADEEET